MATDITVSYALHVKLEPSEREDEEKIIANKIAEFMSLASEYTMDYIWQNESFALVQNSNLQLQQRKEHGYICISGETNCGESIEDEWFIVFLLTRLTIRYPDIAVSVEDDDGQFLLIEAADNLPRWLKPETSENRVFIHRGKIHIIPQPSSPAEIAVFPANTPSLQQSLELLFSLKLTLASQEIQNDIKARIDKFSSSTESCFHHAHCFLPVCLSHALDKRPDLVSLAVRCFCKDIVNISQAEKCVKTFDTDSRLTTRVRFTKLLYSQLLHKSMQPRVKSNWRHGKTQNVTQKSNDLGFQLAAGFGFLCDKYKSTKQGSIKSDLKRSSFYESLRNNGFFKNEVEGSKEWSRLNLKAEEFYLNSVLDSSQREEKYVETLLNLVEESKNVELRQEELLPEDDDSWLDTTQDQLDEILQNRLGRSKHEETQQSASENLKDVVGKFKEFVGRKSDFEGVEVENEAVQFNSSSIEEQLQKLLNGSRNANYSSDENTDSDESSDEDSDLEQDAEIQELMTAMEEELRSTTIAGSFQRSPHQQNNDQSRDAGAADVDCEYNLIKNFLASVSSQEGHYGPVSNILTSLGMSIPPDTNE